MTLIPFKNWRCRIEESRYSNGRIALTLTDSEEGDPIATATINLPDEPLAEDEVCIKSHSENEGMLEALEQAGIVKATGRVAWTGRVAVPVCKLLRR